MGGPGAEYPFPWSINRWLPGTPLALTQIDDPVSLARDLAAFLGALYQAPHQGPVAGAHSFYRGGSLAVYDEETRLVIAQLGDTIDAVAAIRIWDEAIAAVWTGPPVWVHGDVAVGNLLIQDGQLAAVIDFGCCAVGDPACDTVMAWTYFTGESRVEFRRKLPVATDVWIRGRGCALWKALITINGAGAVDPQAAEVAQGVLDAVLAHDLSTNWEQI